MVGTRYSPHGESSMAMPLQGQPGPFAMVSPQSATAPFTGKTINPSHGLIPGIENRQLSQPQPQISLNHSVGDLSSQHGQLTSTTSERGQRVTQVKTTHSQIDWETHRPEIKKLYMDERRDLEYTRREMNERFGFNASVKHYKEKFSEWQWSKHLPTVTAAWMVMKGTKRQREQGRDTEFVYGSTQYTMEHAEKTVKRSKIKRFTPIADDAPTPAGMEYHTPKNDELDIPETNGSEKVVERSEIQVYQSEKIASIPSQDAPQDAAGAAKGQEHETSYLKLRYKGRTRKELEQLHQEAHELDRLRQTDLAEEAFSSAFEGMQRVLWPTHDKTTNIAYCFASFYAKHEHMKEADAILDCINDAYVQRWGLGHKRTIDHLLHVRRMLEQWSRPDDAMSLISQAFEKMQLSNVSNMTNSSRQPIQATDEPAVLDYQLMHTHTVALIDDKNTESCLSQLTSQRERYPEKLGRQTIEAWFELGKFYNGLNGDQMALEALYRAREAAQKLLDAHQGMDESLLNIVAEVALLYIEYVDLEAGSLMLTDVESAAVALLGTDHEKLIELLVRFGMFYQNRKDWMNARRFFEHAFAASLSLYGPFHYRCEKLQDALDNEEYRLGNQQCESIMPMVR